MEFFNFFGFSDIQWILIIITAILVGLSKTGVSGATILIIPVLASSFGGKVSSGIMLIMLVTGDLFALLFYRKHADLSNVKKLLPWTMAGLLLGLAVGNIISDDQFKTLIAILVIVCLILLIITGRKGDETKIPKSPVLSALAGIAAGFSSMIGNAAVPIFSVYLLARGFKKYDFMGTAAWFFLIINLIKIPLQIFVWHSITIKTFLLTGLMLPVIAIGALSGTFIIKRMNEKVFRYFIIGLTAITAIRLLF